MCDLRALVTEASAYASILTIVTFSTERWVLGAIAERFSRAQGNAARLSRVTHPVYVSVSMKLADFTKNTDFKTTSPWPLTTLPTRHGPRQTMLPLYT